MIYNTASDWLNAPRKRVLLFGMSGLGKTHVSNILRAQGDWFHYSVDYRIGTRYMGEFIVDSCIKAAMKDSYLAKMLRMDAIYIAPNVHTHDLGAVSTYLGKPGDSDLGGLPIEEFRQRQLHFMDAEVHSLRDTGHFIGRAERLYGYPHFVCDTGGSICEWVDPDNPDDPIMAELSAQTLMVWIEGSDAHTAELVRRFDRAPKPMAYQPEFLTQCWADYLAEQGCAEDAVNPDAFIRWTYARALAHRQPRYRAMADRWGLTVCAEKMGAVQTAADFEKVIADALEMRG